MTLVILEDAQVVLIKMVDDMELEQVKKKKLFNPNGDDSIINRTMINGNTTNLFNLNNIKYNWAKELYRVMMGNLNSLN